MIRFVSARRYLERESDLGRVETVSPRTSVWASRLLVKPFKVCFVPSLFTLGGTDRSMSVKI